MGKLCFIFPICLLLSSVFAQNTENSNVEIVLPTTFGINSNYTSPPLNTVRSMAEWEEVKGVFITWRTIYPSTIKKIYENIISNIQKECKVYVICSDTSNVKKDFLALNISLNNIEFINTYFDTQWIRDYGPNTVYSNEVDSLLLVNGIYNKPQKINDNNVSLSLSSILDIPLYSMTVDPYDFNFIGGNYMTDGLGKAFSSKLVIKDNNRNQSASFVDSIVKNTVNKFFGINDYILLDTLENDKIHHLDLNMKLLDEETILVGQFPYGKSDYFNIEKNIDFIEKNVKTSFDTKYKIIRIPMASDNGYYPPENNARFKSYTNAVFVNKLILVPIYGDPNDAVALDIWRKSKPGYTVVGINCEAIVGFQGALHCITKEIGVNEPLWITHKKPRNIKNNIIPLEVKLRHRTGIDLAKIYYRFDNNTQFNTMDLDILDIKKNTWLAELPKPQNAVKIEYYIEAKATNGKIQKHPLAAPVAFHVLDLTNTYDKNIAELQIKVFPNPADQILKIESNNPIYKYEVIDMLGRVQFSGDVNGLQNIILDLNIIPSNIYQLRVISNNKILETKFIKK
jgi:agmatine deiminase